MLLSRDCSLSLTIPARLAIHQLNHRLLHVTQLYIQALSNLASGLVYANLFGGEPDHELNQINMPLPLSVTRSDQNTKWSVLPSPCHNSSMRERQNLDEATTAQSNNHQTTSVVRCLSVSLSTRSTCSNH